MKSRDNKLTKSIDMLEKLIKEIKNHIEHYHKLALKAVLEKDEER